MVLCILSVCIVGAALLTFYAGSFIASTTCATHESTSHYWWITLPLFVGWGIMLGILVGTVAWLEATLRRSVATAKL